MTHRTVPLDLLVRVRHFISANIDPHLFPKADPLLAELAAQIEQQGQREPVAWYYKMTSGGTPIVSFTAPSDDAKSWAAAHGHKLISLYATPQDSVPAWAWRQAICDYDAMELEVGGPAIDSQVSLDWIESRALALAQTKG